VIVGDAKDIARRWVKREASSLPGFGGAFFHGSTNWLADDAMLSPSSDVDVVVVLDDPDVRPKWGKIPVEGALLDISIVAVAALETPEQILARYELAGSFRTPGIVLDPTGRLATLQKAVAKEYGQRRWVEARLRAARDKGLSYVRALDETLPLHEQVTVWAFGAGLTTHVLLVAGLKNPTVRRRFLETRVLLEEYGRLDLHEELLDLLGCAALGPERVAHHLSALEAVFDVATTIENPFPFAGDLTAPARPIAIDGSREMIERGLHREAVFWIVATWARCRKVLDYGASAETLARFEAGFEELLADLGVSSFADRKERAAAVEALLPRVEDVARAIMDANPEIVD
jgi:hypothetical protein